MVSKKLSTAFIALTAVVGAMASSPVQAGVPIQTSFGNVRFFIQNGRMKMSLDIRVRNASGQNPQSFAMGNSSYLIKYTQGSLVNSVASYVNPKYTAGSSPYQAMQIINMLNNRIAVQLRYAGGAPGSQIATQPGGDLLATIVSDVTSGTQPITLKWDHPYTDPQRCASGMGGNSLTVDTGFQGSACFETWSPDQTFTPSFAPGPVKNGEIGPIGPG